jgi:hypothetical protein
MAFVAVHAGRIIPFDDRAFGSKTTFAFQKKLFADTPALFAFWVEVPGHIY